MSHPVARGYDALAQAYAEHLFGELAEKPFDRAFLERFAMQAPAGRVLDLGCGPGQVARFLAGCGRDVAGIDLSPRMIEIARQLNPEWPFTVGDMTALELPAASCAGVVAFYAIVHLDARERSRAFAEIHRVLVPNGLLGLAFHVGSEVVHVEELWGVATELDFRMLDPVQIESDLRAAGFVLESRETRAPYPPPIEAQTSRAYLVARRPQEASSGA